MRLHGFWLFVAVVKATMVMDEEVQLELTVDQVSGTDFESTMTINGVEYISICDCSSPKYTEEVEVKCAPDTITLTQDKEGEGATIEEMEEKLAESDFPFVSALLSSFRCIDGRITEQGLFALGGDFGEFALALLVYEDMIGKRLDKKQVKTYLNEYIEWMEQDYFYWCTDDDANNYMESEIGLEGIDFTDPRDDIESELLKLVIKPEAIGDLHIKNLIMYNELYSARIEAVQMLIQSYYELLWDKENSVNQYITLEILPGKHNETAWLEIKSIQECFTLEVAPVIVPREGDKTQLSCFVHHFDGVAIKRNSISLFFAEVIAKEQDGITTDKFYNRMNHHGNLFLDTTGSLIAGNLPFYTANFENK